MLEYGRMAFSVIHAATSLQHGYRLLMILIINDTASIFFVRCVLAYKVARHELEQCEIK